MIAAKYKGVERGFLLTVLLFAPGELGSVRRMACLPAVPAASFNY